MTFQREEATPELRLNIKQSQVWSLTVCGVIFAGAAQLFVMGLRLFFSFPCSSVLFGFFFGLFFAAVCQHNRLRARVKNLKTIPK